MIENQLNSMQINVCTEHVTRKVAALYWIPMQVVKNSIASSWYIDTGGDTPAPAPRSVSRGLIKCFEYVPLLTRVVFRVEWFLHIHNKLQNVAYL